MIEQFTNLWFKNLPAMREKIVANPPSEYKELVNIVVQMLHDNMADYHKPDPSRIHEIDDGDYQGTLVYVIASTGYQPSTYWYVRVYYGSCSGCDTLAAIRDFSYDKAPTDKQVGEYMTLALHILQGLRQMDGEGV